MKLEEYEKMTDEQRLNFINELEEKKENPCRGLEEFLHTCKNNETKDKEKWISVNGIVGECAVRISDIEYMEQSGGITHIVTKKIKDGKNVVLKCHESPSTIITMIAEE